MFHQCTATNMPTRIIELTRCVPGFHNYGILSPIERTTGIPMFPRERVMPLRKYRAVREIGIPFSSKLAN